MESAGLEVGGKTQKAGRSHLRTHTATCNQQRSESHFAKVLCLGWEWGKKQKKELISGSVHLRSRLPPSAHPCGSRTPLVQMHKYPGNPPTPPPRSDLCKETSAWGALGRVVEMHRNPRALGLLWGAATPARSRRDASNVT